MSDLVRITDLVGVPYKPRGLDIERDGGLDCWGLAREYLRRTEHASLPADPALLLVEDGPIGELVSQGQAIQAGDILVIDGSDDVGMHLGVAIDPFRFLHTGKHVGRSTIDPIDRWERAKLIRRVVRPFGGGH